MPNPLYDDSLAARFADYERRLSALERSPVSIDTPFQLTPFQNYDSSGRRIATGSTAWVVAFDQTFPQALYPGLYVEVHVQCPVGSTAEVKLTNMVQGGAESGVYSIGSGEDRWFEYKWLHGQRLTTGPFAPTVEFRVVTGSLAYCYLPTGAMLITPQGVSRLGGFSADGRV